MTNSPPRQRPSASTEASGSRIPTSTDEGSHNHGQQECGTGHATFNSSQHLALRNPTSNRPDFKTRRKHEVSPQCAQLVSARPAEQASSSRRVRAESERASFTHLRRNAISEGIPHEDYRYRTGQPSQRELTEEVLNRMCADLGESQRPKSPANRLDSNQAVCDGDEDVGGEGLHNSSSTVGKHSRSSESSDRSTKRQERWRSFGLWAWEKRICGVCFGWITCWLKSVYKLQNPWCDLVFVVIYYIEALERRVLRSCTLIETTLFLTTRCCRHL